ncbi:hypothetical protein PSACC_00751 [Paramicrosporidium saccamoebae]|uniref:Uncharacterized protein n=1 Tax=Paramicrosporidium saccamoebae TaxID=1246581 RepID=A0A2H9TNW4_9FUNG|nr:hypothetical protein PSACC_00751 [Paramicrosporidium saccamoebae]
MSYNTPTDRERPRIWALSLDDVGYGKSLSKIQSLADATRDLMEDPSVGKVVPRIAGKTVEEIDYSMDTGAFSAQHGFLLIGPAPKTVNSIETLFLVHEKIRSLEKANDKHPGLFTQLLGIRSKSSFDGMACKIRGIRNRTAHPRSFRLLEGTPSLELIPKNYHTFAKILVAWDPPPNE